jgi:hypothetical protein
MVMHDSHVNGQRLALALSLIEALFFAELTPELHTDSGLAVTADRRKLIS